MPKMVCVDCEVEFKIKKNGVVVAEMFQKDTEIYKLWRTDLWKCPVCGKEVVAGFASNPYAEHYHDNCVEIVNKLKAQGKQIVYDKEKL